MVQMSETSAAMRAWEEEGRPLCKHPHMEREYAVGAHTGDDVCTTCGAYRYGGSSPKPKPQGVTARLDTANGNRVEIEVAEDGTVTLTSLSERGEAIRVLGMTGKDARELAKGLTRAAEAVE